MTRVQKLIIYGALSFAIILIVSIVSLLINGVSTISSIFTNEEPTKKFETYGLVNQEYEELDIELISTSLEIVESEKFEIKTNNSYVKIEEKDNKLIIKEKKHSSINVNNSYKVKLYLPENYQFDNVKIDAGAGVINIEDLFTNTANFNLGAGKVDIENIVVSRKFDINGGTGVVYIESGAIYNMDFDMGVGEVNVTAFVAGNSTISAGIGALKLNLLGVEDDYTLKLTKGLGNINVDKKNISKETTIGSGKNTIKVEGAIGSIDILFSNSNLE